MPLIKPLIMRQFGCYYSLLSPVVAVVVVVAAAAVVVAAPAMYLSPMVNLFERRAVVAVVVTKATD